MKPESSPTLTAKGFESQGSIGQWYVGNLIFVRACHLHWEKRGDVSKMGYGRARRVYQVGYDGVRRMEFD